jgi:hypothetical protein
MLEAFDAGSCRMPESLCQVQHFPVCTAGAEIVKELSNCQSEWEGLAKRYCQRRLCKVVLWLSPGPWHPRQ